jgi:hypothetical protein
MVVERDKSLYSLKYRLKAFGLAVEDYDALLISQNGRCFACGRTPSGKRLAIDHCHKTGLVRGLLCNVCNRTLGHLERDGVEVVKKLIGYLERPPAVAVIGEHYGGTGRAGTKKWRRQARRRHQESLRGEHAPE